MADHVSRYIPTESETEHVLSRETLRTLAYTIQHRSPPTSIHLFGFVALLVTVRVRVIQHERTVDGTASVKANGTLIYKDWIACDSCCHRDSDIGQGGVL